MKNGADAWAGLVAVNVAAVFFGSSALFGKLDVSPVWIVAGRAAFAAITLATFASIRGGSLRIAWRRIPGVCGTGALLALHWVTFFMSVQQSGIAVATLTFATFPLFTGLFDALMHRRKPSFIEVASGSIIVAAVWLLVDQGIPLDLVAQKGAAIGLSSAALFAMFSVLSQKLGKSLSTITLSLYQNVAVFLLLIALLPFADRNPHGSDWAVIAVLGVVATALMHQLYFFSLKRLPAAVCGGFIALEPVYAIILAAIFFSEPIGLVVILSGALIISASLMQLFLSRASAAAS